MRYGDVIKARGRERQVERGSNVIGAHGGTELTGHDVAREVVEHGQEKYIDGNKGNRGDNYPDPLKVWISGQFRRVTKAIRREMRRRAAVEPVIGHLKDDHRMRRNYLKGRDGDRINAVLAAGYNFSLLLRWFSRLLRTLLLILARAVLVPRFT